jgi:hypothetical protein
LERSLAEACLPPKIQAGQYPPAPHTDTRPEPLSLVALALLGTVLAVVVLAVAVTLP